MCISLTNPNKTFLHSLIYYFFMARYTNITIIFNFTWCRYSLIVYLWPFLLTMWMQLLVTAFCTKVNISNNNTSFSKLIENRAWTILCLTYFPISYTFEHFRAIYILHLNLRLPVISERYCCIVQYSLWKDNKEICLLMLPK